MRGPGFFVLASLLVPAAGAAAAPSAKSLCVVTVETGGPVTAAQLAEATRGLKDGIASSGASVLDDATSAGAIAAFADPATGECDETCEQKMRAKLADRAQLVLARLSATTSRFALRVTGANGEFSALGLSAQLRTASMRLGNQVASSGQGSLILTGGPKGAEWFVDGARVDASKGAIRMAPGRHVVRVGTGAGAGNIAMVEVIAGEVVTAAFAEVGPSARMDVVKPPLQPSGPRVPREGPGPGQGQGQWATRAGIAVVSRTHRLSGADGGGFAAAFTGAGPQVAADFRAKSGWIGTAEGSWISYGFSKAHFNVGTGTKSSVSGGSSAGARLGGGWRFGHEDSISVAPLVAIRHERYASKDPRCPPAASCVDGERLGLLPSYARTSVDLLVRGALPVGTLLRVDAELGASPYVAWSETPANTTGKSPRSDFGPTWRLGADASVSGWMLRADYAGELRATQFKGAGPALVDPDIRDGKIEQSTHALSFSFGRRF